MESALLMDAPPVRKGAESMTMRAALFGDYPIPEDTVDLAHAIAPHGNRLMHLRDHFGMLFDNQQFSTLFSHTGQPALAPARLAMVTILQFMEDLPDRQAADAVRMRIDWKYVLGLPLADRGFDASVLSEFRARLVAGDGASILFETLLERLRDYGLLRTRGQQRTDSTHVLAAVRGLSRIECLGETMRATLNALATVAPAWVRCQIPPPWFDRYGPRADAYRFPKAAADRQRLAEQIGADGFELLTLLAAPTAPRELHVHPAVCILRRVWWQQYHAPNGPVRWREVADMPPSRMRIHSPYDRDAQYSTKRNMEWTGYKVHLTETFDADLPCLITHVLTTPSTIRDGEVLDQIHEGLARHDLLPSTHLVDTGYTDAAAMLTSQSTYGITLCGPIARDSAWQAKDPTAFDITRFQVDWDAKVVICPQGHASTKWISHQDRHGNPAIRVTFRPRDCRACPVRTQCTHTATAARGLSLRPREQHEVLQQRRHAQTTDAFKRQYAKRAGVEGLMSQATRVCGMRQSRYGGMAKTRLQHVLTACALNLLRSVAWVTGGSRHQTQTSRFVALRPPPALSQIREQTRLHSHQ